MARRSPFWKSLHVRGELAESLVEVVHLRQDAHRRDDDEHVGRRVGELVVSGKGELQGNAQGLDGHDRDGAGQGADAQIDQRVLLSIHGRNLVDGNDRVNGHGQGVEQKGWLDGIVQNFVNGRDVLVGRRVKDDDDGANEADGTAELAQCSEDLAEEVGAEDGAHEDA